MNDIEAIIAAYNAVFDRDGGGLRGIAARAGA